MQVLHKKTPTQVRHKRILVAPLNWGLGHATRCIPIINALLECGFEPILASDGAALDLLKKEFPNLKAFKLPSYNITYPKNNNSFKFHFLKKLPSIIKTIRHERLFISKLASIEKIDGIISDNRFGVWHTKIPSVYITHQLNVLSGNTTWISSKLHQKIIKKYTECWIPDFEFGPNLSGTLGHPKTKLKNLKYIRPLSRFEKQNIEKTIDKLVILSGPEPQRAQLEIKLLKLLKNEKEHIVFVRGIIENEQKVESFGNISKYNFMISTELEDAINSSKLVISRSGYTTIMDLAKLGKKAIFIPTPGQFEQLYLAQQLDENLITPCVFQNELNAKSLKSNSKYSGFESFESTTAYKNLFDLF